MKKNLLLATLISGVAFASTPPTPPITQEIPQVPVPPKLEAMPSQETQTPVIAPEPQQPSQEAESKPQESMDFVNIGIKPDQRKQSASMLNTLLANEYVLYVKTLNYHWNIVGPFFGPLHALFKDQYEALEKIIDEVAERTRALDVLAAGSMHEFIKLSQIQEMPGAQLADVQMIKDLLDGHEAVIKLIRTMQADAAEKYNDMGTNNLLLNIMEKHEKIAWMLRSHLAQLMAQ